VFGGKIALAAVLALSVNQSSAIAAPATSPDQCWELMQTSLLAGNFRVIVTAKAFRIESIGHRYVIISKAPDWRVYAFNPLSKTVFESDAKKFKGDLASGTGALGGYLENLPVIRAPQKPAKYLGEAAFKTHVDNPKPQDAMPKAKTGFNSVFFNTGDVLSADYWTWGRTDLVPRTLPVVLNKIYKLPQSKDLPLKLLTLNTERETHSELETKTIKRIPLDPKIFILPPNLRAVKEDIEVANDGRRQNSVKNLIQNWDEWGKIVTPKD
jgi:hypothetical protein